MITKASSARSALYDIQGRPVPIGRSLGRGGEAEVYTVPSRAGIVAKVYHSIPDRTKQRKLAAMTALSGASMLRVAAWPVETLHRSPGGDVVGLIMPLVERHRELHALYSPAQRRQVFPLAGWDFLLRVALNLARAVSVVHSERHVIGDVNQKNVVVSEHGEVRLLDCDSFQIHAGGELFPCEVGVPDFTPPELHGKPFRGVVRTQNHDAFGLAILLFHVLFMGRHPFAGVYRRGSADMQTERAIREGRYVYSVHASKYEMAAPPHALLPATLVTSQVVDLFERAFALQTDVSIRPSAADWVVALTQMERVSRRCGVNRGHGIVGSSCPWCAIERNGGPDFFLTLAVVTGSVGQTGAVWNLDELLRRAAAIPAPNAGLSSTLKRPVAKAGIRSEAKWNVPAIGGTAVLYVVAITCLFGIFEYGILFFVMIGSILAGNSMREKARKRLLSPELQGELQRAIAEHEGRCSEWVRDVERPAGRYAEVATALDLKQRDYRAIPSEHQKARRDLSNNQRQIQLRRYLESKYVRNARIDGVGQSLKQTLLSFGLETAADLTRASISNVPGFGPARTAALLTWRQAHEARFVFDPRRGVDPADLAAVDQQFAALRRKLEQEMDGLLAELNSTSMRARGAAQRLQPTIESSAETLAVVMAKAGIR